MSAPPSSIQRRNTIQIWLKPLEGARRSEQSQSARLLLQQACAASGIKLPENFLSLPGLDLIKQIKRKDSISVSLTHCSGMAAVALSGSTLGVDCEQHGRNRQWGNIAQQFFTAVEAKAITSTLEPDQESEFLRHWVLKEAYIKANHGELFSDINHLALTISGGVETSQEQVRTDDNWWVSHVRYGTYHIGICNKQPIRPELLFFKSQPGQANGYVDITGELTADLLPHSSKPKIR